MSRAGRSATQFMFLSTDLISGIHPQDEEGKDIIFPVPAGNWVHPGKFASSGKTALPKDWFFICSNFALNVRHSREKAGQPEKVTKIWSAPIHILCAMATQPRAAHGAQLTDFSRCPIHVNMVSPI